MVEGAEDVKAVEEEGAAEDEPEAEEVAGADGGVPVEKEGVREWTLLFVFAGTEPKDLIPPGLIVGTVAGEDDMGVAASSMDPKVPDEPGTCEIVRGSARGGGDAPGFVALVGVRAPTPPLNNMAPCPSVIGRLEWVGGTEGVEGEGAGD